MMRDWLGMLKRTENLTEPPEGIAIDEDGPSREKDGLDHSPEACDQSDQSFDLVFVICLP